MVSQRSRTIPAVAKKSNNGIPAVAKRIFFKNSQSYNNDI